MHVPNSQNGSANQGAIVSRATTFCPRWLVPWKCDALHESRSAAGWQGAKSELVGHK